MPFYLWLRFLTGQKLVTLHRHHLGVHMRDASREVPLDPAHDLAPSSAALAAHLLGREPRPSEAAVQAELRQRLEQALERMDPADREILALRHFEQLTNAEAAVVLNLQESAASKRYIRAIRRLKEVLADLPGGLQELEPLTTSSRDETRSSSSRRSSWRGTAAASAPRCRSTPARIRSWPR